MKYIFDKVDQECLNSSSSSSLSKISPIDRLKNYIKNPFAEIQTYYMGIKETLTEELTEEAKDLIRLKATNQIKEAKILDNFIKLVDELFGEIKDKEEKQFDHSFLL